MHDTVPLTSEGHLVPAFNPGANPKQVGLLRIVNEGEDYACVTIWGIDGPRHPGGNIMLWVPPGQSRSVSAQWSATGKLGFQGHHSDDHGDRRQRRLAGHGSDVGGAGGLNADDSGR